MLENVYPVNVPPMVAPSDESSSDDQQFYDLKEALPPAPPIKTEVRVPTPTADIAKVEVKEVDSAPSQVTEAATEPRAAVEPSVIAQAQRVTIQESKPVVTESAVIEPVEAKTTPVVTVPNVQARTDVAAESVSTSVLDREYDPLQVSEAEFTQLQKPAHAEDVLQVVKRIPIPSTKTDLVTEVSDDDSEHGGGNVEVFDEATIAASIVRNQAAVINVTTEASGPKPVVPTATPETGINPFDEQGPIPVRKVRLTGAELDSLPKALDSPDRESLVDQANDTSMMAKADVVKITEEGYPKPVKRIAEPQREPGYRPPPVHRIQLSELPVQIQQ